VGRTCSTHGGGETLGVGRMIKLRWPLGDRDRWGKLDSDGSG